MHKGDAPPISLLTAAALSVSCTLAYVLPFYLSRHTRPSPFLSRDAPSVIRARIRSVSASCVAASLAAVFVATQHGGISLAEALHLLGWWPLGLLDSARSLLLVAVLFAGPLFEALVCEGRWRGLVTLQTPRDTLGSWLGWRNYVAGPVTEEIVFRSVLVALHLLTDWSPTRLVFVTPLYFGIAHVHHFYEFRLTHPDAPLMLAVLRTVLQFSYTSLFGFYAAFLFLRTGSLAAVVLTHSFCNCMGLPRFWGRVEAPVALGPQDVKRRERGGVSVPHVGVVSDGRLHVGWTVVYYTLLAAGAYGFYLGLWPLTTSSNALTSF